MTVVLYIKWEITVVLEGHGIYCWLLNSRKSESDVRNHASCINM